MDHINFLLNLAVVVVGVTLAIDLVLWLVVGDPR
jgi:hypothetical protein